MATLPASIARSKLSHSGLQLRSIRRHWPCSASPETTPWLNCFPTGVAQHCDRTFGNNKVSFRSELRTSRLWRGSRRPFQRSRPATVVKLQLFKRPVPYRVRAMPIYSYNFPVLPFPKPCRFTHAPTTTCARHFLSNSLPFAFCISSCLWVYARPERRPRS